MDLTSALVQTCVSILWFVTLRLCTKFGYCYGILSSIGSFDFFLFHMHHYALQSFLLSVLFSVYFCFDGDCILLLVPVGVTLLSVHMKNVWLFFLFQHPVTLI